MKLAKSIPAEIIVIEENCVGCKICELKCSSIFHQKFVPSKAYIQINHVYELTPTIIFLDGCTKCGQCVKYCLYGALNIKEDI